MTEIPQMVIFQRCCKIWYLTNYIYLLRGEKRRRFEKNYLGNLIKTPIFFNLKTHFFKFKSFLLNIIMHSVYKTIFSFAGNVRVRAVGDHNNGAVVQVLNFHFPNALQNLVNQRLVARPTLSMMAQRGSDWWFKEKKR